VSAAAGRRHEARNGPLCGGLTMTDPARGASRPPGLPGARDALTILHVAGPRCGRADADEGALAERLRGELGRAADEHGIRADLLIVAGDLADGAMPGEYARAVEFLARLAGLAGVPRRHVAIVPGGHDVNRKACQAHILAQESVGKLPVWPYFPKWGPYRDALAEFYSGIDGVTFTPDEPWTVFAMPDLGVVVAGLNSTMTMTHLPDGDICELGGTQLNWFADHLTGYQRDGWLRLAAIRHAGPADASAMRDTLAATGKVQLTIAGEQAPAAGYELITVTRAGVSRYPGGGQGAGDFTDAARVFGAPAATISTTPHGSPARSASSARDAYVAENITIYNEPRPAGAAPYRERDTFLDRVAEVTRLRYPRAAITEHERGHSRYLRVSDPKDGGVAEIRPVGVLDGAVSEGALAYFVRNVHGPFAAADPGVDSQLVYFGPAPDEGLARQARRQGVRLRSFVEYQGLLNLGPLVARQRQRIEADDRYPAALYVDQRFTVPGTPELDPQVRDHLVRQAVEWLDSDVARFVMVLGDFGRGKTAFLRQLTRVLPGELPSVIPVLVELRTLEKAPTLDDLLAQHLIRHGVEDVSQAKLRYMVESGRVALLFDGFDELELRVGFDSAADYLETLLDAVSGQAKLVLTSRTQHFRSTQQVQTALGNKVQTRTGSRVAILEDFTEDQILAFLTKLYDSDASRARQRFDLIKHIAGLLELTRNPRMLAFVAQLDTERLLAVQAEGGELTAGGLYQEIIDYWLTGEAQRQQHRRGLAALTKDERFTVCTDLALRLWQTTAGQISLNDLSDSVTATLTRLAERGFSNAQATHSIASGSLLVRTEDDAFQFVHLSVMEWLVAAHAARELTGSGTTQALSSRQMSRLMAAFFTDLAGRAAAVAWAFGTLVDEQAPEVARQNALAVAGPSWAVYGTGDLAPRTAPREAAPLGLSLAGMDLRGTDLNNQNLRGASLRGAVLRGMRLDNVNLAGADLTDADLSEVVMTGGSVRGATLAGSKWHNAALLGTAGANEVPEPSVAVPGRDRAQAVIRASVGAISCVAFSPDSSLFGYGSREIVRLADTRTGQTLHPMAGGPGTVTSLAWSSTSNHITVAYDDGSIRMREFPRGPGITVLGARDEGGSSRRNPVAWSPDGTRIASPATSEIVSIMPAASGSPARRTLIGHRQWVTDIAWSPDGTRIATASADGTARTWDAAVSSCLTILTGHEGAVTGVAWSPGGASLATTGTDGTVRIWDMARYAPYPAKRMPGRHPDTVQLSPTMTMDGRGGSGTDVAFSPSGNFLATAWHDGMARLWSAANGSVIDTLAGHAGPVTSLAFAPDGSILVTASEDGTIRFWDVARVATYAPKPAKAIATFLPLPENGYAVLYPDGSYKLAGDPGDDLWWTIKECRFRPGELDPYALEIRRLPDDATLLPRRGPVSGQ
jgi:hypothetical protein